MRYRPWAHAKVFGSFSIAVVVPVVEDCLLPMDFE